MATLKQTNRCDATAICQPRINKPEPFIAVLTSSLKTVNSSPIRITSQFSSTDSQESWHNHPSHPSRHAQICIVPWQFIFDPFQQSLRRVESHGAGGHFGGDKDFISWDTTVEEARQQGIRKAGIPRR